jgi:hypothetical protein
VYTIVNKTTKVTYTHTGNFPMSFVDSLLNADNDIIVISTYSNTIKVPQLVVENGETRWEWTDYPFNPKNL